MPELYAKYTYLSTTKSRIRAIFVKVFAALFSKSGPGVGWKPTV
jgi:hypothetical protein